MDIGEIYMPRVSHTTQTFERLLDAIDRKGLQVNTARAGVNILSVPGLQIDIVAPVRDNYNNLNDWSAVVLLTYGSTAFLFTGDAEALSEGHITADISADVLKVGHHGSRTSTSQGFLDRVAPTYAVITVGANNSYGHPTEDVLRRLSNANVSVFRTDQQGTIIFTSDGSTLSVNTEPTRASAGTPAATARPATQPAATARPTAQPTAQPTATPQATVEPTATPAAVMVWLAATGTRYHRINNCGRMNPNNATQVTLEEAKRRNFDPCANCNPPR
jgi:competence protein ComEC